MENENLKTTSQPAEEANQAGHDTKWMTSSDAPESGRGNGANFPQPHRGDAKQAVADAAGTAKGYAQEAKETAKTVLNAGRAYSQNAVDAAGDKLGELKGKMAQAKEKGTRYVVDQPMQSVLIAAAGGAMLTALFLSAMRATRR